MASFPRMSKIVAVAVPASYQGLDLSFTFRLRVVLSGRLNLKEILIQRGSPWLSFLWLAQAPKFVDGSIYNSVPDA